MATKIMGQRPTTHLRQAEGLNAAQLRRVLQFIASRAEVAQDLLLHTGTDLDDMLRAQAAAIALLTAIGAMADEHSDTQIAGGADRWNFGPDFADLGKEVRHG